MMSYRNLTLCLLLCFPLWLFASCKDVEEDFSGLRGRVALGPVSGAEIRIFDATKILDDDVQAGLVATTQTDARGNFRLPLPDRLIGRTLLIHAVFPADDPLTPEDERATYVDFDGAGQTVTLEPEDGPWVSMLDNFNGFEVRVAITPFTTMAWHALRSMPDAEVGSGRQRFVQQHVKNTNWALTTSLGLAADIARTLPSEPRFGGNHPSGQANGESADTRAQAMTLMQLDRALRTFITATTDPNDRVAQGLQALWLDASDGVVDGSNHDVPLPFFSQPGAPDVIGFGADGRSKLLGWMADNATLTQTEVTQLGPTFPTMPAILEAQRLSTGACQPPVITSISPQTWPEKGNAEVVVRGRGLLRESKFFFASDELFRNVRQGRIHEINSDPTRPSHITSIRHDEIRLLTPDMRVLDDEFRPAESSLHYRDSNLFLFFERDTTQRVSNLQTQVLANDLEFYVATIRSVLTPGLAVMQADFVRFDGAASAGITVASTNLDPVQDATHLLRLRLYNGLTTAVAGAMPDLTSTTAFLGSLPLTIGIAGGVGQVVFPSVAELQALAANMPAASEALIEIPLLVDEQLLGSTSPLLSLTPVVVATRSDNLEVTSSTQDSRQINDTTSALLQDPAAAPLVNLSAATLTPTALGAELQWNLMISSAGATPARDISVEHLELPVTLEDGRSITQILRGQRAAPLPLGFPTVLLLESNSTFGNALPLTINQMGASFRLGFSYQTLISGNHTLEVRLHWRDPATGEAGTATAQILIQQP